MEISSSMPSASPVSGAAEQDETGLAGMFSSTDGDSADSIDADSFAALMQAFLAAAFPPPPPPKTREQFADGEADQSSPVAGPSAAEPTETGSCTTPAAGAADGGAAAGSISSDGVSGTGLDPETTTTASATTNAATPAAVSSTTESVPGQGASTRPERKTDAAASAAATVANAPELTADEKTDVAVHTTKTDVRATLPPAADDAAAAGESQDTDTPLTAAQLLAYWQSRQADSAPHQTPSGSTSIDPHRALIESALPGRQADDLAFDESDPLPLLSAAEFAAARTTAFENGSAFQSGTEDDRSSAVPEPAPHPSKELPASHISAESVFSRVESQADRHPLPTVAASPAAIGSFAFDQVLAHATTRQDDAVSRIEAQIDPPELGRMRIEISKTPEGMTAHLTVEDPSVLALLDQQMREVQQNLEAAGVPVASFTLSMSADGQPSQQQSRRDDEQDPELLALRPRSAPPRATSRQREIDTTA